MVLTNLKVSLCKLLEVVFFFKKCKFNHCSSSSNSAWCDLNSEGDILKLHDKFNNPKCNFQKIITFTPHQYMLGGGSIKSKLQNVLGDTICLEKIFEARCQGSSTIYWHGCEY